MKNIGVLIYTYDRVDDARINMEIIRGIWEKSEHFEDIKIVHSYNGNKEWYSERYSEDNLVIIENSWHFQGASDLIDAGIKVFQDKYEDVEYIIVLASDTWLIKPEYIENILMKMKEEDKVLATCAWGLPERKDIRDVGIAVDFFIIDLKWATKYKMFPINYGDFFIKYKDLFLYEVKNVMLEKLLLSKYLEAIIEEDNSGGVNRQKAIEKLLVLKDREPVHSHIDEKGDWKRNMHCPKMGLLTHHDPEPKKEILIKYKINQGDNIDKLLKSNDLSYYNNGIKKNKNSSN